MLKNNVQADISGFEGYQQYSEKNNAISAVYSQFTKLRIMSLPYVLIQNAYKVEDSGCTFTANVDIEHYQMHLS